MSKCTCKPTCKFPAAEGQPFAVTHDPRPEMADAKRARLRELGKAGSDKQKSNAWVARVRTVSLRSVDECQHVIEMACLPLLRGKSDPSRANAIRGMVQTAMELLKVGEMERELEELRTFVLQHHPEFRARTLRSVK